MKNVTHSAFPSPVLVVSQRAWQHAVAFHGHACPGLALGCRMALAAVQALGLDDTFLTAEQGEQSPLSRDEELVCVAETDSCSVDAVQSLLGCTLGKGNLLLKFRGKTAMTFYHRPTSRAVRVLWQAPVRTEQTGSTAPASPSTHVVGQPENREAKMQRFLTAPASTLYTVQTVPFAPPEHALVSGSLICTSCGEMTAEFMIRLREGKPYCPDCFPDPSRIL